MKANIFLLSAMAVLAGCATTNSDFGLVRNGQTRCLEQSSPESARAARVRWCTSRQIFQPNRHTVTLGRTSLFVGNDYEDVMFEKQIGTSTYVGRCIPEIDVTDLKTSKPVLVHKLPRALIEACDIKSNERGEMLPFARTTACAPVYVKEMGPLVGGLFPFKRTLRCSVVADSKEIFKASFRYE